MRVQRREVAATVFLLIDRSDTPAKKNPEVYPCEGMCSCCLFWNEQLRVYCIDSCARVATVNTRVLIMVQVSKRVEQGGDLFVFVFEYPSRGVDRSITSTLIHTKTRFFVSASASVWFQGRVVHVGHVFFFVEGRLIRGLCRSPTNLNLYVFCWFDCLFIFYPKNTSLKDGIQRGRARSGNMFACPTRWVRRTLRFHRPHGKTIW